MPILDIDSPYTFSKEEKETLQKILEFINNAGYNLVALLPNGVVNNWEVVNKLPYAKSLELDNCYIFIPKSKNIPESDNNKTLTNQELYSAKGKNKEFPLLKLTKQIYETVHWSYINHPPFCMFTRLTVDRGFIVFLDPDNPHHPKPDAIALNLKEALGIVEQCFVSLTQEQINREFLLFEASLGMAEVKQIKKHLDRN